MAQKLMLQIQEARDPASMKRVIDSIIQQEKGSMTPAPPSQPLTQLQTPPPQIVQ